MSKVGLVALCFKIKVSILNGAKLITVFKP